MLVLTRKPGEKILIGKDIEVEVLEVRWDQVRLGISAPRHLAVFREEIFREVQEENRRAALITSANRLEEAARLLTGEKDKA
ncbi:MAG: carbon storage regulator CsrA [Firmicutes bacterium]|nr:carbon storage regulator CsrA [Bacillota bacterium]MCL5040453.1 carbon storage regulator CsrA [Bacillota bacterium]